MNRQEAAAKVLVELEFAAKMVRVLGEGFSQAHHSSLLSVMRVREQIIVIGGPDTLGALLANDLENENGS